MNEVNNDFAISLNRGTLLPMNHANYNMGRVKIDINDINHFIIQIEGSDYKLGTEKYNKIKEYVSNEQGKLVYYAQLENVPYEGGFSTVKVKLDDQVTILSGQSHGEVANYCNTFIDYIIGMF